MVVFFKCRDSHLTSRYKNDTILTMRTAILYYSKHGATRKIVDRLAGEIGGDSVSVFNIKQARNPNLAQYDAIIIGTPIYAGHALPEIRRFCQLHEQELLSHQLGLFISCLNDDPAVQQQQLRGAYSPALLDAARVSASLGGELQFEKLSFLEKNIIRAVTKNSEDVHAINNEAIIAFAKHFS